MTISLKIWAIFALIVTLLFFSFTLPATCDNIESSRCVGLFFGFLLAKIFVYSVFVALVSGVWFLFSKKRFLLLFVISLSFLGLSILDIIINLYK